MSDDTPDDAGRFLHDSVQDWTPITFGVELVRRLRKHHRVACPPSLRTSVAIPRFLAARYFRTRALSPRDYLEAAVLLTPHEDQAVAEEVARELLFPRSEVAGPAKSASAAVDRGDVVKAAAPAKAKADPLASVLGDLAALDMDLDALDDLADLESMIAGDAPVVGAEDAFALFERLYSSAVPRERAIGELVALFGGPADLQAASATTLEAAAAHVRVRLLQRAGSFTPEHLLHGCAAGFGEELGRAASAPWEVAAVLAGCGQTERLGEHLDDLAAHASVRELGATLRFVGPHRMDEDLRGGFRDRALARRRDLTDHVELVAGLDAWVEPERALVERSVDESVERAMWAGRWLRERFGEPVDERVFDTWADREGDDAELDALLSVAVQTPRWKKLVQESTTRHVEALREAVHTHEDDPDAPIEERLATELVAQVPLAGRLIGAKLDAAVDAARSLATETLCLIRHAEHFLPTVDAFLELHVIPDDLERVLAVADALGVDRNEVLERIGQAIEQLRQLVRSDCHDGARFSRLVDRIPHLPPEVMEELCAMAAAQGNLEAIAALLAIDLGGASARLDGDVVLDALGYKGIGGGSNLLKQWFTHRGALVDPLRARIKSIAKEALVDLAFDWIGKGGGSSERGLVPENRTRPLRPGDELDQLDLEATLERLVEEGKSLDSIGEEDLVVSETGRGRAAVAVLVDISGSMSGNDLAMCSIAVVMMLGKLRAEEVALAVFESDTHVMKRFADTADLDAIADQVLDLAAYGGTRVDAALTWVAEEMQSVTEAQMKLLFLLSDFAFTEGPDALRPLGSRLADLGVRFLGAAHGHVLTASRDALVESIGGRAIKLAKVEELPSLLLDVLVQLGDGDGG